MDPIVLFRHWLAEAEATAALRHPRALCLATLDPDGAPNARFVDLKGVDEDGFLFGTHLESAKARGIAEDPRVALTFYWDPLGRQVRVQGEARRADDEVSDRLFRERSRDSRIASIVSRQSQPLDDPEALARRFEQANAEAGAEPARPATWGAFIVRPRRIEFLEFDQSRLHARLVFERRSEAEAEAEAEAEGWRSYRLQS